MMKAKKDLKVILTIRIHQELKARIDQIMKDHPKLDQADLLRRAIEIGLDDMKLVGYDAEAIYRDTIAKAKAKAKAKANEEADRPTAHSAKRPPSAQNRMATRTEARTREPVQSEPANRNGY
jgi:predicted DNA-binding protein